MAFVLLTLGGALLGAVVRRWWLLTLPLAMAAGGALLVLTHASRIGQDNPLPFLLLLLEAALATGILAGRRRLRPTPPA